MKDFIRVSKVGVSAVLALEVLTGCATRYCCGPKVPYPAETAQHNTKALDAAVDAAGARIIDVVRGDGKVSTTFNQQAVLEKIHGLLKAQVPKPDIPFADNDCVHKYETQATIWGLQASMDGRKQSGADPQMSSTIFGNTWANVIDFCGVKTPERYQPYVQKSWDRSATILNEMKFHRN